MKNGRFLITIILICVITAGLGCGFYVVRKHNLVTNQVQQTGNQKNNQAVTIKKHFYHKSILEVPGETVLADYPKSFNELIKKGQLTVLGTVTDLKNVANDSLPNRPVTMATVKVLQVLSGRKNKKDTTIKVLFMGGNIAQNKLLKDVANKDYLSESQKKEAQSSKIITVKYSYIPLPQIGQEYALILSTVKSGTNGIAETYYMPIYAGKGIFIKNAKDQYLRETVKQPIGGNGNRITATDENDDQLMNQGMNDLINKNK